MESESQGPERFREQIETEVECYARYKAQTKNMDVVIVIVILISAIALIAIYITDPDAPLALAIVGVLLGAVAVAHIVVVYMMYQENKALMKLLYSMDQAAKRY